jgi:DsbE subfamily thiol:disulfide oxidoreductase
MKRFIPVLIFVLFMALLAALLLRPKDEQHQASQPLPVLTLAPFAKGAAWNQDALKGKVTLINFFASWCTPCEAEMHELVALRKQFPHLNMVGVAWNDDEKTLGAWLKKHGNPFHGVWVDMKGENTIALGIKGIPETLIVDDAGQVRYRLAGPVTEALLANEINPLLETLTAEASHAP